MVLPIDAAHMAEAAGWGVFRAPMPAKELLARLATERNITGGLPLSRYFKDRPNDFLVCVTEMNSRAQIDALVEGLRSLGAM